MITVEKMLTGNTLTVKLSGAFDETADLFKQVGEPPLKGEMIVDCQGIKRQNSTGVKNWIKYFQYVNSKGTSVRFQKCSPAIVDQFNLVSNFGGGGVVESLYTPYSCVNCEVELVILFSAADVKAMNFVLPEVKCVRCVNKVVFADDVDEYFSFLIKG